jgi:uncharacterized LabA/DUF88 family protein
MQRVVAYVDGFNLYHGLKEAGWRRYYWLNLRTMCQLLLRDDQTLEDVKYFTSRVRNPEDKRRRQTAYLMALKQVAAIAPYEGKYSIETHTCPLCTGRYTTPVEKMTDVNMGIEIVTDAFLDAYDAAWVVSADRDLLPAIWKVRRLFPTKQVDAYFGPRRKSTEVAAAANHHMDIRREILRDSQMPDCIKRSDGTEILRPEHWR